MPVLVVCCIVERLGEHEVYAVLGFVVNVVLGFVCVNLRDLRETLGFLLCRLIEYSCVYSPADSADYAEEYSKLYYFAEKDIWN